MQKVVEVKYVKFPFANDYKIISNIWLEINGEKILDSGLFSSVIEMQKYLWEKYSYDWKIEY